MAAIKVIDKELLSNLGIRLSGRDFQALSSYMEDELRRRVIAEIADEIDVEQARQLAEMRDGQDDQILEWLRANVSDFSEIVSDEIDILLGEFAEDSGTFIRRAVGGNV